MKTNALFEQSLSQVSEDVKLEIGLSFDIVDRICNILERKKMSQKDFASLLGKKESEISKWMRGTHNFTLETIAKISSVLHEPIIEVAGKNIMETKYVIFPYNIKSYYDIEKNNSSSVSYTENLNYGKAEYRVSPQLN